MKKRLISGLLVTVLLMLTVATVSADGGKVHIVKAGDSLTSIAYHYGVSTDAIMQANGLSNANYIYVHRSLITLHEYYVF